MTKFKSVLIALVLLVSFSSCSKDDDLVISEADLPAAAKSYLQTHFQLTTINKVVKDTDDLGVEYEVYLANGTYLEFNGEGAIDQIKSKTKLPDSVIPASLLSYVASNYPDLFIIEWELDTADQEIKLSNGVELKFDLQGNFLRIDR
jgi:hypothetical protein